MVWSIINFSTFADDNTLRSRPVHARGRVDVLAVISRRLLWQ
jgi:hypothetical protein